MSLSLLSRKCWNGCESKRQDKRLRLLSLTARRVHIFNFTPTHDRSIFRAPLRRSFFSARELGRPHLWLRVNCPMNFLPVEYKSLVIIEYFQYPHILLPVLYSRNLFPLSPCLHWCTSSLDMFKSHVVKSQYATIQWVDILH